MVKSQSFRDGSEVTLGVLSFAMKHTFVVSTSYSDSLSESYIVLRTFFLNGFFGLFEEDDLFLISRHSVMICPGFRQLNR